MKMKATFFLLFFPLSGFSEVYMSLKGGLCKPQYCDGISYKKDILFSTELGYCIADWRISTGLDYVAFDRDNMNEHRNHLLAMQDYHSVKVSFFSINICRDFCLCKELSAYVGLGFGPAYVRLHCFVDPDVYNASRYTLAGKFLCGLAYKISEKWTLVGGYKVIKVANSSFTPEVGYDENYVKMPLLHCFEVGLRYTF